MTTIPRQRRIRRGFTLVELMVVVVLVGVLMRFALPFFRTGTTKSDVRGAADAAAAIHELTKQTAIQRSRVTRMVMDRSASTMVAVANKVSGSGVDTVGKVVSLASRFGVTFTTSPTRDTLIFTPRGIGTESSDTKIIITKGGFYDTVSVSSAGRLIR